MGALSRTQPSFIIAKVNGTQLEMIVITKVAHSSFVLHAYVALIVSLFSFFFTVNIYIRIRIDEVEKEKEKKPEELRCFCLFFSLSLSLSHYSTCYIIQQSHQFEIYFE